MFNRLQSRRASSLLDMPKKRFAGKANPASKKPFSQEQFAEIICDFLEDYNEDVSYFVNRDSNLKMQIIGRSMYNGAEWTIYLSNKKLDFEVTYEYELPNGTQRQHKELFSSTNMFYDEVKSLALAMTSDLQSLINP